MFSLRRALLLVNALFFPSTTASPAGAPIPSSFAAPVSSQLPQGSQSQTYTTITSSAVPSNAQIGAVPGAWSTDCYELGCIVYCRTADTACHTAAQSLMDTCTPIRGSYINVRDGATSAGSGWYNVTTTVGPPPGPSTTTIDSYTSFSTANATFTKLVDEEFGFGHTTITPVYALGSPVPVESVTTIGDVQNTYTHLTAPMPSQCVYSYLMSDPSECGQCHIGGGTVDLYFWPPATASESSGGSPSTTVLNGTTLVSPTAYIYLSTISARNSCSGVGKQHTGTLFAIDPWEVSTQIHIGGKVAAYEYAQLDYRDLTGLPPAREYELQPSCFMFGCETIYSTQWHPTLKVPPQVRSIDPAWAHCGLALEGLYDPPIALQPRAAAASATQPADEAQETTASPSMTWKPVTSTRPPQHDSTVASRGSPQNGDADPTSTRTLTSHLIATTQIVSLDFPDNVDASHSSLRGNIDATGGAAHHSSQTAPGDELDSTSTLVLTSHVIASTRVVSIGDPDDVETGMPSPATDGAATDTRPHADSTTQPAESHRLQVPDSVLTPKPLQGGNGVVVDGEMLQTGQAITLGTGRTKTTLSLQTQAAGKTWLAYGTSVAIAIDPILPSSSPARDLGSDEDGLAFTQASDGNFVLHGTTLLPGESITIGSGRSQTTLAVTTLQSGPAIVIDGRTTQQLAHPFTSTSRVSLPAVTQQPSGTPPPVVSTPATTFPVTDNGASFSSSLVEVRVAALMLWVLWTLS